MNLSQYVSSAFQDHEIEDIMRAPVSALLGVVDTQFSILASLRIETVFDLAASHVFADARRLLVPGLGEQEWRDLDLYPQDLLGRNVEVPADIGSLPLQSLARLSARAVAGIKAQFGIETIGELANWPPYLAARKLAGFDVGTDAELEELQSPGIPDELIPEMNGQASEKAFYTVYSETKSARGRPSITGSVSLDQIADRKARSDVTQGHILRFEQSWTPIGLTLGNLLHSLALAPGEATRIAITSWERQQSASTSENISQNESLSNLTTSARTISEITSAVAREASEGFSNINSNTTVDNTANAQYGLLNGGEALAAGGAGFAAGAAAGVAPGAAAGAGVGLAGGGIIGAFIGGIGAGPGAAGGAAAGALIGAGTGALVTGAAGGAVGFMGTANFGSDLDSTTNVALDTVTVTSTDGTREIESEMMQSVSDQTQQQASSARTRTASIVQEVSQSESENVSTRVVANYNHMHAMTVQYFEVVQTYRQETRLMKSEPCVFVPVDPVQNWTPELIRKYRGRLLLSSLSADFTFHLLAGYGTVGLRSRTFNNIRGEDLRNLTDEALQTARHILDSYVGSDPHNDWRLPDDATIVGIWGPGDSKGWTLFDTTTDQKYDHKVYALRRTATGQRRRQISSLEDFATPIRLSDVLGFEYEAEIKAGQTDKLAERLQEPHSVFFRFSMQAPDKIGTIIFDARGAIDSSHIVKGVRGGRDKIVFPMLDISASISLKKAIDHLTENTEWYSRQILRLKDRELARSLIDNLAFGRSVLGDHVDPEPVAINGNRLVFKLQSKEFRTTAPRQDVVTEELVPVGTGGVFAEAVLGRANSAEKIDLTRFWNWQDSPIPLTPPEIAPVQLGSRAQAVNLLPGRLDAPLVQNTAARDVPDPQGTIAVLNTLQQQLFKDMSGILETAQVAQTAMQQAVSASTATGDAVSENLQKGMEQTGRIVEQASKMVGDFGSMIAEKSLDLLNTGVSGVLGSGGGVGGLLGSTASGATGLPALSSGGSGSAARGGASIAGPTSLGSLGSTATGVGGALNEARKTGSRPATVGSVFGPNPQDPILMPGSTGSASTSLPSEIIRRSTGVPADTVTASSGAPSQDTGSGLPLADRVAAELRPLVNRATRSDADYDRLLERTLDLLAAAQTSGQSEAPIYDAVGDALSRGWKASALRMADQFNAGDHDAVHRMLELEAHRDSLTNLIDGAGFDLRALLKADISIEDIVVPERVTGGEEIAITGRIMESLSDGTKVPAIGADVALTSRPTLPEHQRTNTDVDGRFRFVINHGVPPLDFDGVHKFEGWFDLELDLSAHSGRTSLAADRRVIVPGEIAVTLIGAFDNETGDNRLIGSVVPANTGKDVTLQFRAMIAGQPLNRGVQLRPDDIDVRGAGTITAVTNPDPQGEFVVVFRPSGAAGSVAYVSPVVRYSGFSQDTPQRERAGFAALDII